VSIAGIGGGAGSGGLESMLSVSSRETELRLDSIGG
jgi:hypothetical protein